MVSVIGDSTFVHSGLTGLAEMVYNPPVTGHVVLILDNGTTAMTGQQEHPGTGRTLNHDATGRIHFEDLARAMGVTNVHVVDFQAADGTLEGLLKDLLTRSETSLIVARQPCVLAAPKIRFYEKAVADRSAACPSQVVDD